MSAAANPLPAFAPAAAADGRPPELAPGERPGAAPRSILARLASGARARLEDFAEDEGGGFSARIVGEDPAIVANGLDFPVGPYAWLVIRVTMTFEPDPPPPEDRYVHAAFYWRLSDMEMTDEAHMAPQPIPVYGVETTLEFRIRAYEPGRLVALRFDPTNAPGRLRVREATIRAEPKPRSAVPPRMPRLCPMMSFGRSGSTLLMRLLGMHPGIFTNKHVEHDALLVTYFLKLYDLMKGAPADDCMDRAIHVAEPILATPYLPAPVGFTTGLDLPEFREHFRRFLEGYLPTLMAASGLDKTETASWYTEKIYRPRVAALFDLWPDSRVISLFRDPHRTFLSVLGIERKWKYPAYSHAAEGRVGLIHAMMAGHYRPALAMFDDPATGDRVLGIRYEDLMADPADAMGAVSEFLGLPFPEDYRRALAGYFREAEGSHAFRRHQTSGSAAESLRSRWKDLAPEEAAAFREYPDVFERLGYPLPAS